MRPVCRRSAPDSTCPCSWISRTGSGNPGSTPCPPPAWETGCRSPSAGSAGSTAPRTARSRRYLNDHITVGETLEVSAPAGDFVVQSSDGPLLLASAGAGITTVLPIVEHIARTQPNRTVIVAHADRTAQDHALRDTVLHVGRQLDNFTAYTWYETVGTDDHRSHQGFMDLTEIPLPADIQVFTCGPLPFMRHIRSTLLARGVPADSIRYEVFGPDLWAAQIPDEPTHP